MQIIDGKFINQTTLEKYQPEKGLLLVGKQAFLLVENEEGAFFLEQSGN